MSWLFAEQKGTFEKDDSYELEVPYHDDRELVMDVLRHGVEEEVIAPARLRDTLLSIVEAAKLQCAARQRH